MSILYFWFCINLFQYLQLASSPQHLSVSPFKPAEIVNPLQPQNFYLNGSEPVMPYGTVFPHMGPLQVHNFYNLSSCNFHINSLIKR